MMRGVTMRRALVAATAAMLMAGAAEAAKPPAYPPGTPAEQAAYVAACVKVSPTLKTQCTCRAAAAMKYSPQLRADIMLSMSNPTKYAARSRSIPHSEIVEWETFSADSAKQCGIDD